MDGVGWDGMGWDGMDVMMCILYIYTFINIYIDKYIDVDIDRLCRHVHVHVHIHIHIHYTYTYTYTLYIYIYIYISIICTLVLTCGPKTPCSDIAGWEPGRNPFDMVLQIKKSATRRVFGRGYERKLCYIGHLMPWRLRTDQAPRHGYLTVSRRDSVLLGFKGRSCWAA